ncbi:DUF3604 domain-containing protein [Acidobacteria bacterium AH-259-A15]|nr:DUF3604 domain-containing protein [Acidobacteria bacterium AH-259-A15]
MKAQCRRLLKSPLTRVCLLFLVYAVVFALISEPDFRQSPRRVMARSAPLNYSHPLEYDASLGMYGQSDHVGFRYPFSPEALAQPVPSPAVAAGLQQPDEDQVKTLPSSKEVVHHHFDARDANASIALDFKGNLWIAYTSFRNQDENVYIRRRMPNGQWEAEIALSAHPLADFNPTVEVDNNGWVWVAWSRQESSTEWPLMVRHFDGRQWSEESELLSGKEYLPVLKRNQKTGDLWLAWEDWSSGSSLARTMVWDGTTWSGHASVALESVPQQHPALASGPDGTMWLAYDVVKDQKYDVRLAKWESNTWKVQPLPPQIEGHRRMPAVDVDKEGRVWLLPETLVIEPIQVRRGFYGQEVPYNLRPPSRAILIWTGTEWKALPGGPVMSSKAGALHIDRNGTVWIIARTVSPGVRDFVAVGQRYRGNRWYTGALDEAPWTADRVTDRHFVVGASDLASTKERVGLVEREDGLYLAWHQTHRRFTWEPAWTYADGPVDTIVHRLAMEPMSYESPQLVDFDPTYHGTASPAVTPLPHTRMVQPAFAATFGGQKMEVHYGDLHHHTEFSRDPGYLNGDVESNYRYVRDIRRLNFLGLADHVEHLNEHDWYRIRRSASFFNNGDQFATFVAFEWTSEFYRSGNYQEGHHNIVYRTDGPEVRYYSASLPESNTPLRLIQRLEEDIARAREQNIEANAFVFPHDPSRWVQPITWSWYNPRVRLFELVQSRGSHEILGGPQKPPLRNDIQQLVGKSAQDGLKRGLRWGFIGSGDHFGRPVAGVFSPSGVRKALFKSLYAKQTFATTGARMVVSFSVNGHMMGTEWKGRETEHTLDIYARGTRAVTLVEVWKNARMLQRWSPGASVSSGVAGGKPSEREFRMQFKDPSAPYLRENWWYIRVMQEDGEIAWSSPVWFVYEGIEPVVIADAGRRQPIYIVPHFPVPIPILMRNQRAETVRGSLTLANVPDGWQLDPNGPIQFELPPESWTTYVWYVKASPDSITELKMVPVELKTAYQNGENELISLVVLQSPKLLNTRGQWSELNDALHLQRDHGILNQWLKTMAEKWGILGP